MRVRDLIEHWEETAAEPLTVREYRVRLPVEDAARVAALAEIYPRRRIEDILTELLTAALDEVADAGSADATGRGRPSTAPQARRGAA